MSKSLLFRNLIFLILLSISNTYVSAQRINQEKTKVIKNESIVANTYLQVDTMVNHGDVSSHVRIYSLIKGQGKYVTILPSLGRGVEDYTEEYNCIITTKLVENGYQVVLIQPRGIGLSTGDLTPENISMYVLVEDIFQTLQKLGVKKVNLIGHAFGNRLARTYATIHPESVDKLVLMAAGGGDLSPDSKKCLLNCFNMSLPKEKRLEAIKCAFFAPGNDPNIWYNGWYPKLAMAQTHAIKEIDENFFKKAGGKEMLLFQALEDFVAPPKLIGLKLKEELGTQIIYVEIPNAGHALSSEQSDLISHYLIQYFNDSIIVNN